MSDCICQYPASERKTIKTKFHVSATVLLFIFYQVRNEEAKYIEGNGHGLAIVKSIVGQE